MKEEVRNGIVLAICVILILVIVYFATAIFMTGEIGNKKISSKKTTTTESNESEFSNLIMASSIFSKSESNYMVVIFSKKTASNELKEAIKGYSGETKLYIVNLDEPINKAIKSNTDSISKDDLKVKDSALITIENGDISSSVIGGANIIGKLK